MLEKSPPKERCFIPCTNRHKRTTRPFRHLQDEPEEFHETLRQIPMRWRSSLSGIMSSMESIGPIAPGGGLGQHGAPTGDGGSEDERKVGQ